MRREPLRPLVRSDEIAIRAGKLLMPKFGYARNFRTTTRVTHQARTNNWENLMLIAGRSNWSTRFER